MKRVTIIGGGISGLAAAYYLEKKGASVTLLESSNRLGGKIITENIDGFVVEGGPDSFITEKPWAVQLCNELGLADELIPLNEFERGVYVVKHGRCIPFPRGFRLAVPTEIKPFVFSNIVSPLGKLRMGLDYFIPSRSNTSDESLGSFFRRRLGQEAVDRIAGPIMGGIFSADPDTLSMQATFPRFLDMEKQYGSLIRAMRAGRKKSNPAAKPPPIFYSLKNGMATLVGKLTSSISGEIKTGCTVEKIVKKENRFKISTPDQTFSTDAVIVTSPATTAAPLLEKLHPVLASKLKNIRYINTATMSLAYRAEDIPTEGSIDGYGLVIPAVENRKIVACTWASRKFDHRAPPNHHLLRVFIGGYRNEALTERPDAELLRIVQDELKSLLNIQKSPLFHRIYRWPKGNPQYDVGHLDRVAEIETLASEIPGLYLAGSAYRGIGMPDCIKSATNVAEKIINHK